MANTKIQQLKKELSAHHDKISEQAFRAGDQHAQVSLHFVAEVLSYIDEADSLADAFYKVKAELSIHHIIE